MKNRLNINLNLGLVPVLILFFSYSSSVAQKVFSIEDAVTLGKGAVLAPKTLSGLSWIPGTHTHYHYAKQNDTSCIVFYDVDKRSADTLNLARINFALKQYNGMHRPTQPPLDDLKSVPWIQSWKNERLFRFQSGQVVFLYDIKGRQLSAEHGLEGGMENKLVHAETGHIAYTTGQNVFVKFVGAVPLQITFDSTEGIVNGTAVHRNEFGIQSGLFWSDEGRRLAYYRMDESMVTQYPVYDIDKMPAQGNFVRYPFAGATSHEVSVWVFDSKTQKKTKIKTEGPVEQYLTNISWDPSGKFIYIAVVNRAQDHMWLNKYDAETGDFIFTLFEEKHEKYVEPENPMFWVDDNSFIWQSERDGFNHLYHYSKDGILLKQLTSGNWLVSSLLGKDKKGKNLFFMATKQSPLNNNLYQVELKSGKITEITSESGVHTCRVSEDGTYVLDIYSNAGTPNIAQRISLKDGAKTILHKAANPLT
ncbi:MAG TPA: S9 family peptidase, partial [Bacteroidetes bacterium]|nr:S9 family peptidase [Bacteroidota bacterium]